MRVEVVHDTEKKRFSAFINGTEAYMEYDVREEGVLDYFHTYVPSVLRGQGYAGQILKAAAEYAKQNGFKVIATCSYARSYLSSHDEYKDLILE